MSNNIYMYEYKTFNEKYEFVYISIFAGGKNTETVACKILKNIIILLRSIYIQFVLYVIFWYAVFLHHIFSFDKIFFTPSFDSMTLMYVIFYMYTLSHAVVTFTMVASFVIPHKLLPIAIRM